jgi:hypothetical protein
MPLAEKLKTPGGAMASNQEPVGNGPSGENATNQFQKLSILRMQQDLRFGFRESMAEAGGPVLAPAGEMSRLHAPPLSANFCACR